MSDNKALLVIDVQNGLVQANPYKFEEVFKNILSLINNYRKEKQEIIFVQHTETDGELSENTEDWKLYDGLGVEPDDFVMKKHHNSAFKDTNLNEYLKAKGINHLIIVGMQTEFCIDSTSKAAFELGFKVTIPQMTNTTFESPYLSAEQIYRHYNEFLWKYTIADTPSIEQLTNISQ